MNFIVSLQAFVHTSTAYANCNRQFIEEKFYEMPMTGDKSIQLGDCLSAETLDKMTPE